LVAAWPAGESADSPRGVDRFQQSRDDAARAQPQASQWQDPLRPVFLHGLWRSGSTYVWSRFRAAQGTLCYYEPLHDGLRRLTGERIRRDTADNIQSNGHPAMSQPYFAEFAPLIAGRGVRGYRRRFAYSRFAQSRYEDDRALEAYIWGLVDHARGRERAAVLGFNRTGLRVGWIADRFDACNIHIDRDPIDVFSSYLSQLQSGNHYYFVKWMQIIAGNAGYPLFAAARSEFCPASPFELLIPGPKKYYRGVVEGASLETLYTITFLAWAVCALHALEHCDLIIDPAQADQAGYGRAIAEAVGRESGLVVNFDDMHTPQPPSPLVLAHQQAIEHKVLGWIAAAGKNGLFDGPLIRGRLDALSPRRAELLARVV
jgi:hypothetical protein